MYCFLLEALSLSQMSLAKYLSRLNSVACLSANLVLMTNFLSRMLILPSKTAVFRLMTSSSTSV